MIRRGIIEKVINNKSVKVRVPTLCKSSDSPYAVSSEALVASTICCQPGSIPVYNVGDVVYVAYNEGDVSMPVVMGMLLTDKTAQSSTNINASSVISKVNTHLSNDTVIGDINYNEIKSLSGIRSNIQFQMDLLDKSKNKTYVQKDEPLDANVGDLWLCLGNNSVFQKYYLYCKISNDTWVDVINHSEIVKND